MQIEFTARNKIKICYLQILWTYSCLSSEQHFFLVFFLTKWNAVVNQLLDQVFPSRMAPKLTHCILVDSSTVICWMSPFVILGVSGLFCCLILLDLENPVANSADLGQMPHYVVTLSNLGLYCLFKGFQVRMG